MPDDTPAGSAPALGFSITANIDPGRQIVFQSFVPLDASTKEHRDALSKALDLADFAERRYTVKGLKIALESNEDNLKKLNEQASKQTGQIADLQNAYAAEWAGSGRKGEFELKGTQKTNVDNARLGLENHKKSIANLEEQIVKTKGKIAELEAPVG